MDLTSHPSSAMNFTESQHGNNILEKLFEQLADSKFCDVVLHIQEQNYHAHRCVLASCSPYFENVFKENANEKEHITINSQNLDVFESVFTYMYTGKIAIDTGTVSEILRFSNYFILNKLKGYCSDYLERNLHINNVYFIKDMAEKWGLPTLSKTAHGFILANLLEVVEQKEILQFDEYKIDSLISNKSFPLTEELKVHIICRWVGEDIVKRHKVFQQLMAHIQWPKLNVQTLYTMIQSEKLFSESEWCMWHILKLLEEKGLLLHVYTESLRYLERKVLQGQNIEQQLLDRQAQQEKDKEHSVLSIIDSKTNLDKEHANKVDLPQDKDLRDDTGFSSDSEQTSNERINKNDTTLSDLPDLPHPVSPVSLETVTNLKSVNVDEGLPDSAMDTSAIDTSVDLNESTSSLNVSNAKSERGKHKRKGMPVKLRIPKSRLKLPVILPRRSRRPQNNSGDSPKDEKISVKKKRGRPPKKGGVKQSDAKIKASIKVEEQPSSNLFINMGIDTESDDECSDDIPDDSDIDESYTPIKIETQDVKPAIKVEKGKRRKPKGRKKRNESNVYIIHCEYCQFKTGDENMLLKHMNRAHQDGVSYNCSLCEYETMWNRQYYKHMKTHFPGPPFKCDYEGCEHVSERIQPLLYHRMRHTDERPFACTVCNMKFRTKNNLATHMRCHTGEKPWECNICARSFATKGTLEQHSVTHSEVRPYLCDTCGFSTKYQSHLIAHKRIHTGDVFRCQYPNCKYYTPKRSQLACHMRSHMSIRQHICSVCSRAFVERSHLVRHERIHLEDRPFKCTECDYGSTRRDKLKEHILKYHSENSTPKSQYKPRKARKQTFDPAAFPDYSAAIARSVQEDFQGQMNKAVQQRNEIHAQIEKSKKENKEWTDDTNAVVSASTSELTQLKNVIIQSSSDNSNIDTQVTNVTTNNTSVLNTATINYQDTNSIPIGMIDPNNSNNILLGNHLALTIDSRGGLNFVQPQGMQTMLNAIQPISENSQQIAQSAGVNVTSYSSGSQPGQVSADLSQLHNLMGGLFSGITNM